MKISQQHKEALRALRNLSPQERLAAMYHQDQEDLHQAEREKDLGEISRFRLSPAAWDDFKSHIQDGGGTDDAHGLVRILLKAVLDDDQATFWPELVHLLKSAGKHLGITKMQDGQFQMSGVSPGLPEPKE